MAKLNLAIIFGGKSAEHEVSLQSAKNIIEAASKKKYNIFPIGITKKGEWLLLNPRKPFLNQNNPEKISLNRRGDKVAFLANGEKTLFNLTKKKGERKIDVAFPILHGPFGEDGTVQGLLKLSNIPFVGAGVLGSALGMDKEVMKRLFREAKLPSAKFLSQRKGKESVSFALAKKKLGLPIFIKPANMGSSVGVSKVESAKEFQGAVRLAKKYDNKIIFEQYIPGREIECSVLGNEKPKASIPGEIVNQNGFYSYRAKYIDKDSARLVIPAKLDGPTRKKVQDLAIKAFKTLECSGLARVDFFLKRNGQVLLNEVNTLPGFTNISMYPKLWQVSGLSYSKLIDKLVSLARA